MWLLLLACAAPEVTGPPATEPARARLMLHGGGSEDDALFARFVEAAGHGTIVTLGAVEADDPDLDWWDGYWTSLGAADALTVNTRSRDLAEEDAAALAAADGIFVRGGDQAEYLALWAGAPVQDAIRAAWADGAALGGSSAGCAILGERIYDARVGSVASYEALNDPFDPTLTFSDAFVDALPGVLTDTHFTERGRLGRLVVSVELWRADGGSGLGIGVDPRTALFVSEDGRGEVVGDGSVTIVDARDSQATLSAPPSIRGQRVWALPAGYVVDLAAPDALVVERPAWVEPMGAAAVAWSDAALDGDSVAQRRLGDWWIDGLEGDPYAWADRALALEAGDGVMRGAHVLTGLYADSDRFENLQGGMFWAAGQVDGLVTVGLDIGHRATVAGGALTPDARSYALILDARTASHRGVSPGPWPAGALEGAELHVVGPAEPWSP